MVPCDHEVEAATNTRGIQEIGVVGLLKRDMRINNPHFGHVKSPHTGQWSE